MAEENNLYDPENEYQAYTEKIDQIDQTPIDATAVYNDWQKTKKPIVDIIMRNYKKPEPQLSPEQVQRAKYSSAISDTLSSLGEMFAHGKGARVRNRTTPTNTQYTNARLQTLQDKQDQDMLRWQSMMGNAEMQDFTQYQQQARESRGEKRQYYLRKAEMARRAIDAKIKAENEAKKAEQEQANFDKKFKEDVRSNKAGEAIDWARINSGKEETKKTIPIFLNGKEHAMPSEYIDKVVSIAIKRGIAGTVPRKDGNGNEPITATTDLTPAQRTQIFQKAYPKIVRRHPNGRFLFDDVEIKTWKKPKTQSSSTQTGNSDPLGLYQ